MADKVNRDKPKAGYWFIVVAWAMSIISFAYTLAAPAVIRLATGQVPESWQVSLEIAFKVSLILAVIAAVLSVLSILNHFSRSARDRKALLEDTRRLLAGQTHHQAILTQISENLLLSDAVKSVAFREKDRAVLEEAIHQDIRMEKWESAELLINNLSSRFGCKQEAIQLKEEMQRYQRASIEEKIDTAIKHIESLFSIHHYAQAQEQIEALMQLYPGHTRVEGLKGETAKHRGAHKKFLLTRWDESLKNKNIDEAVELLKLLDSYLSPTEAASLEESARGIYKAKLHNMGSQFSGFVTQHKWDKALRIGREITEEFPNSRMAKEVREKLSVLEAKAIGPP